MYKYHNYLASRKATLDTEQAVLEITENLNSAIDKQITCG